MYRLSRPTREEIGAFLEAQARLSCSHGAAGITARAVRSEAQLLEGFRVGRAAADLGHGLHCFESAVEAIRQWRMFPAPIEVCWPDSPIEEDAVVAVLARPLGVWSLNALRVLEVITEENETHTRFGFAYGTLPDHAVVGEERFGVEWNRADDRVRFELVSCSRQGRLAARVAAPISLRMQARFRAHSVRAVRDFVRGSDP